jgi:hypothetical protein
VSTLVASIDFSLKQAGITGDDRYHALTSATGTPITAERFRAIATIAYERQADSTRKELQELTDSYRTALDANAHVSPQLLPTLRINNSRILADEIRKCIKASGHEIDGTTHKELDQALKTACLYEARYAYRELMENGDMLNSYQKEQLIKNLKEPLKLLDNDLSKLDPKGKATHGEIETKLKEILGDVTTRLITRGDIYFLCLSILDSVQINIAPY